MRKWRHLVETVISFSRDSDFIKSRQWSQIFCDSFKQILHLFLTWTIAIVKYKKIYLEGWVIKSYLFHQVEGWALIKSYFFHPVWVHCPDIGKLRVGHLLIVPFSQLESIVRISESLAKMRLEPFTTDADVEESLRLFQVRGNVGIRSRIVGGQWRQKITIYGNILLYPYMANSWRHKPLVFYARILARSFSRFLIFN